VSSTSQKTIIASEARPLAEYKWGQQCDAFVLVDTDALSVKLEQMPPLSSEMMHFHRQAQQFFYVLEGEAVMEIDGQEVVLGKSEGVLVEPGAAHRIMNRKDQLLRFVVTSHPNTRNDRFE